MLLLEIFGVIEVLIILGDILFFEVGFDWFWCVYDISILYVYKVFVFVVYIYVL